MGRDVFGELFGRDVAVDLGTANTLVFVKGQGVVVSEPSVVAVNTKTDQVLAVGSVAKSMIGRTPGNIVATQPLKDGVIADFEVTEKMLAYLYPQGPAPAPVAVPDRGPQGGRLRPLGGHGGRASGGQGGDRADRGA